MHMADALISPAVGGALWLATAGLTVYSARRLKHEADESRVPLMGLLGAFIFAAQMINFTIPATGSSGHLGGGMILAIMLGPHAAFLTMASVLTVQALFFGDGGLLALGCNIFNLGFWPCFLAYPFIYKPIAGQNPTSRRIFLGASLAAIAVLQLGAFSVVLETLASGVSELPFTTFVLFMQPIHLAIGIVEAFVTSAVVTFVWRARPEVLPLPASGRTPGDFSPRLLLIGLAFVAVFTGSVLAWFASAHPDGLEWATFRTSGKEELTGPADAIHGNLARIQEQTAFLPDYGFKTPAEAEGTAHATEPKATEAWPRISAGTSASGIVGGGMTLILAGCIGFVLRKLGNAA
jgi:cobalt/nickel transport system permease protein